MASHVPFLAVRPNEQFSTEINAREFATPFNSITTSSAPNMDSSEAPILSRVTPASASRIPAALRFVLVCFSSFALSALLYTLSVDWAGYELAAVSRDFTGQWQTGMVVARKMTELSVAWYAGYDWKDLAGLACLSNLPYYFLLHIFYDLHLSACFIALSIDISSIAIPFALLRPLIHAHEPGKTANQQVAQDPYIFGLMALFGSAIYAVTIYSSLYTWLPVHIVTHFEEVRSLHGAHDASVMLLLGTLIPVGWATSQFLFTPVVGSRGNPGLTDPKIHPEKVNFDPEGATLGETLAYNLGLGAHGFPKRAEVLAKRTAVLVACSVTTTTVRTVMTVAGTEPLGAIGWASVWGVAGALTSVAYAWAENE